VLFMVAEALSLPEHWRSIRAASGQQGAPP